MDNGKRVIQVALWSIPRSIALSGTHFITAGHKARRYRLVFFN